MAPAKKDDSAAGGPAATPVRVDNRNARSDKDAYEGSFVKVIAGDHEGAEGVFQQVASYNTDDGYPDQIVVKFTADPAHAAELATVNYSDVVPRDYTEPPKEPKDGEESEAERRYIQTAPDAPAEQVGSDASK